MANHFLWQNIVPGAMDGKIGRQFMFLIIVVHAPPPSSPPIPEKSFEDDMPWTLFDNRELEIAKSQSTVLKIMNISSISGSRTSKINSIKGHFHNSVLEFPRKWHENIYFLRRTEEIKKNQVQYTSWFSLI